MYQCDHCNYKSERIWCINCHTKAKHRAIQTGTGVLTREQEQPITQHVQQTSRQTQNVPIQYIEDAKGIIRQWQEAYKNMETRNKELLNGWQNHNNQWEAAGMERRRWMIFRKSRTTVILPVKQCREMCMKIKPLFLFKHIY